MTLWVDQGTGQRYRPSWMLIGRQINPVFLRGSIFMVPSHGLRKKGRRGICYLGT